MIDPGVHGDSARTHGRKSAFAPGMACPLLSLIELVDQAERAVEVWAGAAAGQPGCVIRRPHQALTQPAVHECTHDDVGDERAQQGRDRPPPERAERDGEAEGEERVGDRDDALGVVGVRGHPAVEMGERPQRPCAEKAQEGAEEHHAGNAHPELRDDPAAARDALRPEQPVGAALQIEDERGGQQQRGKRREQRREGEEDVEDVEPRQERGDFDVARRARLPVPGAGRETGMRVDRAHVDPDRDRDRGEQRQARRSDQRLRSLLSPADPDHRATSSLDSSGARMPERPWSR